MNEAEERDRNRQSAQPDGSPTHEPDRPISTITFTSAQTEEQKAEEQRMQSEANLTVNMEDVQLDFD